MENIPSHSQSHIPCNSMCLMEEKNTRKTGLGEDYQQRMIKMLPFIAWIVGPQNTVHQSSFAHTKKPLPFGIGAFFITIPRTTVKANR